MSAASTLQVASESDQGEESALPHIISSQFDRPSRELGLSKEQGLSRELGLLSHQQTLSLGVQYSFRQRLSALATRLSPAWIEGVTSQAFASHTLSALRQFFIQECGTPRLDDALKIFRRRMCMEPEIERLLLALAHSAERCVSTPQRNTQTASLVRQDVGSLPDPASMRSELEVFFLWWARRQQSISALGESRWVVDPDISRHFESAGESALFAFESAGASIDGDQDALFNIRVVHDEQWAGLCGLKVSAGVFLRGRVTQPMWLRLQVLHEGVIVRHRRGFEQWVDDFVCAQGDEEGLDREGASGPQARPFAVLSPLRTRTQRKVFDAVELFVPYRALDLPQGNREIELSLGLFDEYGFLVAQHAVLEQVSIPSPPRRRMQRRGEPRVISGETERVAQEGVPSPQFLGYAETDSETGSSVAVRDVVCVSQSEARGEVVAHVQFEVCSGALGAANTPWGAYVDQEHQKAALRLEFRILDQQGAPLSARTFAAPHARDAQGAFVWREDIMLSHPLRSWRDLTLRVPLSDLDLGGITPESITFAELVLTSGERQIIGGSIFPIHLPIEVRPSGSGVRGTVPEMAPGTLARGAAGHLAPERQGQETPDSRMALGVFLGGGSTTTPAEFSPAVSAAVSVGEQLHSLVVREFEVTTGASSVTSDGERAVRVSLHVEDARLVHRVLSVGVATCLEDQTLLSSTALCVALDAQGKSGRLVVRVPERKIVEQLPRSRAFPLKLSVCVQLSAMDGRVLLHKFEQIRLSETSSVRHKTESHAEHVVESAPPSTEGSGSSGPEGRSTECPEGLELRVPEMAWEQAGAPGSERIRFHVDVPTQLHGVERDPSVYIEFLDDAGEPIPAGMMSVGSRSELQSGPGAPGSSALNDWLPGTLVTLQSPDLTFAPQDRVPAWTQLVGTVLVPGFRDQQRAVGEMTSGDEVHAVVQSFRETRVARAKLMLFSGTGKLVFTTVLQRPETFLATERTLRRSVRGSISGNGGGADRNHSALEQCEAECSANASQAMRTPIRGIAAFLSACWSRLFSSPRAVSTQQIL